MSFWADNFWQPGFWAVGFWQEAEAPVDPPPYRPSTSGYAKPIPLELIDFDTQLRIQDERELVEIVQILAATGVFYGKV